MLKVLLVDDEPFIIQGLKVIIDWENEEFEIAGTASNGKEALQFLENEPQSAYTSYPDFQLYIPQCFY